MCIRDSIDGVITQDMLFMDLIEDFFVYLEVLFESEKIDEFWHMMELMEPLINNLKFTSMQIRLLGLKIRFYRKHHMGDVYKRQVVNWLIKMDYIPSFCTACYREGRTGDRFMALCKSCLLYTSIQVRTVSFFTSLPVDSSEML